MALHLILRRASDLYRDGHFHDQFAGSPNIVDDAAWDSPLDYLFENHDVLPLFTGVPPDDGVNLDPPAWFEAFEPLRTRGALRGFRR